MPKVNDAVSQLAGEIAAKIYIQDLLGKPFNPNEHIQCYRVFVSREEAESLISAALSEREEKIAKLIEAAEEMDSPTSWWDSDMRTCRFCGSENFDSHGLLIHGAACRVLNLRAALSALGE